MKHDCSDRRPAVPASVGIDGRRRHAALPDVLAGLDRERVPARRSREPRDRLLRPADARADLVHRSTTSSAPFLWTVVTAPDGSLYAGSGNEGQVYRIDAVGQGLGVLRHRRARGPRDRAGARRRHLRRHVAGRQDLQGRRQRQGRRVLRSGRPLHLEPRRRSSRATSSPPPATRASSTRSRPTARARRSTRPRPRMR